MNARKLIVLFALALCAGLALYFDTARLHEHGRSAMQLVPSTVERIMLQSGKADLILVNTQAQETAVQSDVQAVPAHALQSWHMESAPTIPLDSQKLRLLLSQLESLDTSEPLQNLDQDPEGRLYGMRDPLLKITVYASDGVSRLEFGTVNSFLKKQYLRLNGADMYLVSPSLASFSGQTEDYFFDDTPFNFKDSDLLQIDVRSSDRLLVLEQGANGKWSIRSPGSFDADTSMIQKMNREIRGMVVDRYLPLQSEVSRHLDTPKLQIRYEFKDQARQDPLELQLAYSEDDETGEAVNYVRASSIDAILKVREAVSRLRVPPLEAFRRKRFLGFANDEVRAVSYRFPDDSELTLRRVSQDSWTVNNEAADSPFVEGLLRSISELEANGYPSATGDFGFERPQMTVRIIFGEDESGVSRQNVLIIGTTVASTRSGAPSYYAVVDEGEVFTLSERSYQEIQPRIEILKATEDRKPLLEAEEKK